jgi:asparagine synthase (glutamine-hydrolysing)
VPRPCRRIAGASRALTADETRRLAGFDLIDPRHRAAVADFDRCSVAGTPLATAQALAASPLARVDGAFSLAWFDAAGVLHVARDPIGHRTLYYALHDRELVFASHLRTLLDAFDLPRRLDLRSVAAFLSCAYVPGRGTLVQCVCELLPGESVTVRDGELVRTAFWDLPPEPPQFADEDDLRLQLRGALEQVISAALPDDGPVCASLSGGIDSSLVVALARRLHAPPVRTFSITFGDGYKNELEFSSLVAAHTRTEHRIVELPPDAASVAWACASLSLDGLAFTGTWSGSIKLSDALPRSRT